MWRNKTLFTWLPLCAALLSLAGCQFPSDSTLESTQVSVPVTHGKLKLLGKAANRDAVPPSLIKAEIGIQRIEIRSIDGQQFKFVIDPIRLDLLNPALSAGTVLARAKVPAGEYDQVRFVTDEQGLATFDDGTELPLTIPSGSRSGLKVFFEPALAIEAENAIQAIFEFDLEGVFHFGRDGVIMRPVLRASVEELVIPPAPPVVDDETGSGETGSGETGSGETGSGETGSGETGSGETGSGETGSGETGSGETGSGETGSGETGSGETGSGETGSGETGSGETGTGGDTTGTDAGGGTTDGSGSDSNDSGWIGVIGI